MIFYRRLTCWVRRVLFKRQYPKMGRRTLEEMLSTANRRIEELTEVCKGQHRDLGIAVKHGLWRWDHPLASHFQSNPALRQAMKSRFEKQIKQVVEAGPVVLQLNQE